MNPLSKEIISEWGLQALPEATQIEMVDRIGRLLYQDLLIRALDILSEKEQAELDILLDLDTTTPQDVLVFLHSKIPTFDQLLQEEKENLKADVLVPVA